MVKYFFDSPTEDKINTLADESDWRVCPQVLNFFSRFGFLREVQRTQKREKMRARKWWRLLHPSQMQKISKDAHLKAAYEKSCKAHNLAILVESLAAQAEPAISRAIALQQSNKSDFCPLVDRPPPDPIPSAAAGVNLTPRFVPTPVR